MHFVYKVIPPRAVFATTMSDSEMAIFVSSKDPVTDD